MKKCIKEYCYSFLLLITCITLLSGAVTFCVSIPDENIIEIPLFTTADEIRENIEKGLKHGNRKWSETNKDRLIIVLQAGTEHYGIPYQDVLAIISIESNYTIVTRHRNRNRTYDYGLTQINGPNWNWLKKTSQKVLNKYNIPHQINYRYDLSTNVMNLYVYLHHAKNTLRRRKQFHKKRWIQSYNTGLQGCVSRKRGYVRARTRYWKKFTRLRKIYL